MQEKWNFAADCSTGNFMLSKCRTKQNSRASGGGRLSRCHSRKDCKYYLTSLYVKEIPFKHAEIKLIIK